MIERSFTPEVETQPCRNCSGEITKNPPVEDGRGVPMIMGGWFHVVFNRAGRVIAANSACEHPYHIPMAEPLGPPGGGDFC